jgi:hypothetical protein
MRIDDVQTSCPKCAAPISPGAIECGRCGIVFAKYEQRTTAAVVPDVDPIVEAALPPPVVRDPRQSITRIARTALLVGLLIWTWQFARVPMGPSAGDSILHLPNLVFHEAGHVLFSPFGRFMTVLGGSLFQFALPLGIAVAFLVQHNPFGAVVCTWWAGENLIDVAPYIADARALQLVLLGGKTGAEVQGHDWEYILATLGWMRFDRALGLWARRMGLLMMIGALIWGAVYLARDRNEPRVDE